MYNMEMEGCPSAGGVRKGAWTREEDILLMHCIDKYGEGKWHLVPSRAGLNRCRKSCRLRWMNYLKPDIKRGQFSVDEVDLILRLHKLLGNRWSLIAGRIPGRTANDVKNYWNTHLRKKVVSSYDNIKPKNSANNNNNNNMIDINNQNMIIKSKSSGTVIIKPRPRTFKRQIIPINPKPRAATPTPPDCRKSREEAAPRCPGEATEQQHYWWESLLDDSARGDEGMIMIGSLLSSTTDDDDIGKLLLVSEADNVGGVANLSSGDHQTTAPLPPLGSPRNEEDDCVWNCMNYSSEFCVEDGLKTCWTDFVLDMDLCDASTDKEML